MANASLTFECTYVVHHGSTSILCNTNSLNNVFYHRVLIFIICLHNTSLSSIKFKRSLATICWFKFKANHEPLEALGVRNWESGSLGRGASQMFTYCVYICYVTILNQPYYMQTKYVDECMHSMTLMPFVVSNITHETTHPCIIQQFIV